MREKRSHSVLKWIGASITHLAFRPDCKEPLAESHNCFLSCSFSLFIERSLYLCLWKGFGTRPPRKINTFSFPIENYFYQNTSASILSQWKRLKTKPEVFLVLLSHFLERCRALKICFWFFLVLNQHKSTLSSPLLGQICPKLKKIYVKLERLHL